MNSEGTAPAGTIGTIGHSTRPLEEMIAILAEFETTLLVDVRTVPRSRRNPQYERDALPGALAPHGIAYLHEPALGGLRRPRPDSINGAWRNASFRGFADYMQTPAFDDALARLITLSTGARSSALRAASLSGERAGEAGDRAGQDCGPSDRSDEALERAVVMCAEAVPWRCHRSLIADALTARGVPVVHLLGPGKGRPHALTPFARVEGVRVTYPGLLDAP